MKRKHSFKPNEKKVPKILVIGQGPLKNVGLGLGLGPGGPKEP